MKAITYTRYGSPEVLELKDIEKPVPGDNDVLVKIYAASTNPLDWHIMRGAPFLARLEMGLFKPKVSILGADIAGRVEATGKNVQQFAPGDEVFGDIFTGGFTEYVCVPETKLALKPANVSFEAMAAVPVAALTALQGLRDTGQIKAGHKVLVNGASGGVGTYAVQIAKAFGAEVTGVCSTRNLELVRSIGADKVIDYTKEDFTRKGQHYDLILDAVGNCSLSDYKRNLKPKGIAAVVGFTTMGRMFQIMLFGPWVSRLGSKKVALVQVEATQADLHFLKELLESGKVTSVIDRNYSLNEVPEAIGYLEKGRARGKVVINIA